MATVLLLQMPFGSLNRPNLGLSFLRAVIERAGHRCVLMYPNIAYAQRTSIPTYEVICRNLPPEYLFGEYLFSQAAHGVRSDYLSALKSANSHVNTSAGGYTALPEWLVDQSDHLQTVADEFLNETVESIEWPGYDLVGMSTTFHQTNACLALARRIKERSPSTRIILGGANCEAEMGVELHRSFAWLDFVCLGEGERLITDLLERLDAGANSFDSIPGLAWRDGEQTSIVNSLAPDPVEHMDDLPLPDFHDWTNALKDAELSEIPKAIPWQTSRGCWYGARSHCIFCGLNGPTMRFRSKSPERALAELKELAKYDTKFIYSVDCVLDHNYFRTLIPHIPTLGLGLMMFFETRPTLTREQLRLLREAGIGWIQPGIESLCTRSLKRMHKGVSAFTNVLLLKRAAETGVGVLWNILYGFAGETADEFNEMSAMVPLLEHLQAPSIGCHRVRVDRFSPMQTCPEAFGLVNVKPYPAYGKVFPLGPESLARMAYYFTGEYAEHVEPTEAIADLKAAIASWQAAAGRAALVYVDREDSVDICDTRGCAVASRHRLEGADRVIFLACDKGAAREALDQIAQLKVAETERILADLAERKLLIEIDGRFVNPAVRVAAETSETVDMTGPYLEQMQLMRYQIDRLKVRSEEQ